MNALQTTQYNLAYHYLGKLRLAAAAVQKGRASLHHGLHIFDKEWPHIQHWQSHAAEHSRHDSHWWHICKAFPLDGHDVLYLRVNPNERIQWLKPALEAARALGDIQAQCAILYQLFQTHFAISALEESEQYTQTLQLLAHEAKDRLFIGRAAYALACVYEERGKYAEARTYYLRALRIFERLHAHLDISMTMNGLGAVALYLADSAQALTYFLRHLTLAEQSKSDGDIGRALLAVSQGYLVLNDFSLAEAYAQRSVVLCRTLGYKGMLCAGLIMVGACAVEQSRLEAAVIPFTEGIQVARAIGSIRNVIHGLSNLGYVHFRLGSYTESSACFDEALQLARESGLPRFICNLLRNRANLYLATGDLQRVESELREALQLAQELNSDLQKVRTLPTAVMLWQQRGFLEQAAIWAGLLVDNDEVDWPILRPACEALESALGTEAYQQALEQGKNLDLDGVITQILAELG